MVIGVLCVVWVKLLSEENFVGHGVLGKGIVMDRGRVVFVDKNLVSDLSISTTKGGKVPEVLISRPVQQLKFRVVLHLNPRLDARFRGYDPPLGLMPVVVEPDPEGPVRLLGLAASRPHVLEGRIKEAILVERFEFEPRRVPARCHLEGRVDNACDGVGDFDVIEVDGTVDVDVDFHVCVW